jgi:hypothetical protein
MQKKAFLPPTFCILPPVSLHELFFILILVSVFMKLIRCKYEGFKSLFFDIPRW